MSPLELWNISLHFDASEVNRIELKLRVLLLVGSSCGFGRWSGELAPPPSSSSSSRGPPSAVLQLCLWFRRWNISRARRLLSASILAAFFAPRLPRRRSVKPASSRRDRTSIHHRSHPHKHTEKLQHLHINKCLISCSPSAWTGCFSAQTVRMKKISAPPTGCYVMCSGGSTDTTAWKYSSPVLQIVLQYLNII